MNKLPGYDEFLEELDKTLSSENMIMCPVFFNLKKGVHDAGGKNKRQEHQNKKGTPQKEQTQQGRQIVCVL